MPPLGAWAWDAEREGFEPSIRFPVYTLSRRAPSTTRTPLLGLVGDANLRPKVAFPHRRGFGPLHSKETFRQNAQMKQPHPGQEGWKMFAVKELFAAMEMKFAAGTAVMMTVTATG